MAVVVLYPSTESEDCQASLPKLEEAVYILTWADIDQVPTIDPLAPTILACGKNRLSFSHLTGPFLFVEDSVQITEELLSKVSGLSGSFALANSTKGKQGSALESAPVCYGLCLGAVPENFDTSSYQAFKAWLVREAKAAKDCWIVGTTKAGELGQD